MPDTNTIPAEVIDLLLQLKFKDIIDFDTIPALSGNDTLLVVSEGNVTGKATLDQFMQHLNENLHNFIMWKPKVENNTLMWERSNDDTAPNEIKFEDIVFPVSSETTSGTMSADDFNKLKGIDSANIVYNAALATTLSNYAAKVHQHDQYQLISEMPKKLSEFTNDTNYITVDGVPTDLSKYDNMASKFIRLDQIPIASDKVNGLFSTDMYNTMATISSTFVNTDTLNQTVTAIGAAIPELLSELTDDIHFLKIADLDTTLGDIGAINLIDNSDFRFVNSDSTVKNWVVSNVTLTKYNDDADYPFAGKAVFDANGVLSNLIVAPLTEYQTVSFYAKAEAQSAFSINAGDGIDDVVIGTVWKKYTITLSDAGVTANHMLKITNKSATTVTMYITNVKVEHGRFDTEYYPSRNDLLNIISTRATTTDYGVVLPDNNTIGFDTLGRLKVIPTPETTGVKIDDNDITTGTTYSSDKIETLLTTKVPIVNNKIPSEYLPGYVDDMVEGIMSIDADGNLVFEIADGQFTSGDPDKGKLYIDTMSNCAYRWSGSTYVPCSTDKLAGSVLVHYDQDDKCMYFEFPESV